MSVAFEIAVIYGDRRCTEASVPAAKPTRSRDTRWRRSSVQRLVHDNLGTVPNLLT